MTTENATPPQSSVSGETPLTQEAVQVRENRTWYERLNEDWFATLLGLVLVLLIVIHVIHAIP